MVYFHISLVTDSKVCQYMSSPTPRCCIQNRITYEGHLYHIPSPKYTGNILPVQNSSDSKVTQLYGTIFGQKNILDRKQKQKSCTRHTVCKPSLRILYIVLYCHWNVGSSVWERYSGTCDLMSLCRILRSCTCFRARQICTNQSRIFQKTTDRDQDFRW